MRVFSAACNVIPPALAAVAAPLSSAALQPIFAICSAAVRC